MISLSHLSLRVRGISRRAAAVLFFAFAFAVMADRVSSVAYAIEAALRALGGHLELLLPTMGLVIGLIALVTLNYWQLVRGVSRGRRIAGGRRPGVRRAVDVPADRRAGGRLRAHDRDLDRRGRQRADRLRPRRSRRRGSRSRSRCSSRSSPALTWFGHGGRLVFARDDLPLHRRLRSRCWRSAGSIRTTSARQRPDHPLGEPGAGRRDPRLPGRDGAGHRDRGAGDLDRPARPARQPRAGGASAAARWR